MPKPLYNADVLRYYLNPSAGLPCICAGIVFVVVGLFALFITYRLPPAVFLFGFGVILFFFGVTVLACKCFCPFCIPARRTCEDKVCCCIP